MGKIVKFLSRFVANGSGTSSTMTDTIIFEKGARCLISVDDATQHPEIHRPREHERRTRRSVARPTIRGIPPPPAIKHDRFPISLARHSRASPPPSFFSPRTQTEKEKLDFQGGCPRVNGRPKQKNAASCSDHVKGDFHGGGGGRM